MHYEMLLAPQRQLTEDIAMRAVEAKVREHVDKIGYNREGQGLGQGQGQGYRQPSSPLSSPTNKGLGLGQF